MPRFAVIDPATSTGRVHDLFQGPLKGKELNLFKSLANSPASLDSYLATIGALAKGLLTEREREAIALAVAQYNGCEYCTAAHTFLARKAGLSDDQTVAVRRGRPTDARLAALITFTNAVLKTKGAVSDADLAAFRAADFNDGHGAEVMAHIGVNVFTNYFNNAGKTTVDFPAPPGL